jgi:hypothetical protein
MAALKRHGISGDVAAKLWTVGSRLRRETQRSRFERAETLDADNGRAIEPTLTGSAMITDLTRHIRAFEPGHTYVSLHTHPNSTSFSNSDVRVLAEHADLDAMVAVGVDGTWHVMSRSGEASVTFARMVEGDYLTELTRLRQAEVPATDRPHLVMEQIAARHGWRYDRVVGSSDGSPTS